MDDGDHPVTPLTSPSLDAEGRLTYVGEDGRRYVVVDGVELDAEASAQVMEVLQHAGSLFLEIESLCHGWLERVSSAPLQRNEAIALLLATLETVLEVTEDNNDDGIADDDIADGDSASPA